MPNSYEISPADAKQALEKQPANAVLIDVREPEEYAVAHLPNSCLIPMRNIPAELQKLDEMADNAKVLVLCHHGVRSLQVVAWLREKGIDECYSIAGGIDRWSRELDPSVPLY